MLAGFVSLVLAFGPPVLPPDASPGQPPVEAPPSEPPVEGPPSESPVQSPPSESPVEVPPSEPPIEDQPITVTPEAPVEPAPVEAPVEPAPVEAPVEPAPTQPAVQRPGGSKPAPVEPAPTKPVAPPPTLDPVPAPEPEPEPEAEPEPEPEAKPKKKLGGFRIARLGVFAKLGYTNGVSQKNGIFDRNKSIQDSIDNQSPTVSGGGDLGTTRFGGFQGGFGIDAEVVGINAWFDFHKFFRPGGMWSLLIGYDHEFGFGERYRLDVGVGAGVQKVFLGKALEQLYYDKDNPQAVNIGTLGLEGRAMVDFHIKLVGPLFTGPQAMIGYHYLWSANAAEVTAEKGMHFSIGWALRIDLATPKLLGRKSKK